MEEVKDLTTDELLDLVDELPVRLFGYREFEALQKAQTATVSDNYPESMTVIEIETSEGETVELLYDNVKDPGFKEPVFIG